MSSQHELTDNENDGAMHDMQPTLRPKVTLNKPILVSDQRWDQLCVVYMSCEIIAKFS